MKVWWCEEHNSENYPVKVIPVRCFKFLVLGNWKIDPPCRMVEMQLVPADARMVTSSDPELREAIIGLMTSFDWRDWPPGEEYINECVTEALDGLGKTANV